VHYDFDGRYFEEAAGTNLARVRQEAFAARRRTLAGSTNCRHMTPGFKFGVSEHPRDEFNADYLITRVRHTAEQPQAAGADAVGGPSDRLAYSNEFEAIPAAVAFRPLQLTERALVDGPQTAVVTGPAGEEIHCDAHGRVKVKFHWDRYGTSDDKSSCWVRVGQLSQPSDLRIPRIGEEVIVGFLEGDPDQPVIMGRLYNGTNQTPYSLPGEKTKSTLKTYSSPGGGGFNELRFEDAAGSEEVFFHAQKDWNIKVLHNRTQDIGTDSTHTVGHDETQSVGRNRARKVGADETVGIGSNQTVDVGGNRTEKVGKSESVTIAGTRILKVTGDESEEYLAERSVSVGKNENLEVGVNQILKVGANQNVKVSSDRTTDVGAADTLEVGSDLTVKVGANLTWKAGGDYSGKADGKIAITGGDEIKIVCGDAKITLKKDGTIEVQASKFKVKASQLVKLKAATIEQN